MVVSTAVEAEALPGGPAAASTGRSPRRKLIQLASGTTSEDIPVCPDSAVSPRHSSGTSTLACLMTPVRPAGMPASPPTKAFSAPIPACSKECIQDCWYHRLQAHGAGCTAVGHAREISLFGPAFISCCGDGSDSHVKYASSRNAGLYRVASAPQSGCQNDDSVCCLKFCG